MRRALTIAALLASSSSHGADAERLWSGKVRPLFDIHCVKCHGPIEQKGGLELDTPQAAAKGGDSGPAIIAAKPEDSPLLQKLYQGADPHMPPKKQLSDSEIESVRQWISAMAAPRPLTTESAAGQDVFQTPEEAIDSFMARAWSQANLQPPRAVTDEIWCRRVYLDAAGRIPSAKEVAQFLAAPQISRKRDLIEALLSSREYAVRMRELWDTFLLGRAKKAGQEDKRRQNQWWAFLESAFRSNRPWNETLHSLITARPKKPEDKGAPWFLYERKNDHQAIAEAVAPAIYGTKIDCAQCHDHPLAREIKQAHYWGLVSAFSRSKNVEGTSEVAEAGVGGFSNFTNLKKESQPALVTLLTGRTLSESWPSGDAKEEDGDDKYIDPKAKVRTPKYSRREAFADAATQDNPLLAKAFVNRMWAVLIGRGIVHPADEINERNSPSHPELLAWLAADFSGSGHDVKRLLKGIFLSRVYALAQGDSAPDTFASAIERPLAAEQIARSWRIAAGAAADDDALRKALVAAMPDVLPREYNATFQQAQFLSNSPAFANLLKPAAGSTLERVSGITEPKHRVCELFRAALGRDPDPEELERSTAFLTQRNQNPSAAARDLLWALLSSAEFLTMP